MHSHTMRQKKCPLAPLNDAGESRLKWLRDFAANLASGETAYALFDARLKPDFQMHLDSLAGVEWKSLWDDSALAAFSDIAPLLIPLAKADSGADPETTRRDELWLRLAQAAERPFSLTLWSSSLPLASVWAHFARYREYGIESSPHEFVLHFYDARVLERLLAVFSSPQRQLFLQPFTCAAYLNRHGAPRMLRVSAQERKAAEVIRPPDALQLTQVQHDQLITLGYPDKLLYQIQTQHGDALAQHSYADLHDATAALIEQARKLGLDSPDDIEMFALAGLLAHRSFFQHPSVQALLNNAAPGSFADGMRNLPQQAWADISALPGAV